MEHRAEIKHVRINNSGKYYEDHIDKGEILVVKTPHIIIFVCFRPELIYSGFGDGKRTRDSLIFSSRHFLHDLKTGNRQIY